jgi:transcriptional regulator with XRE-family HTH domain
MTDLSAVPATAAPEAPAIDTSADAPAALSPVIPSDREASLDAELTAIFNKNNPDPDAAPVEAAAKVRDEHGRFVSTKPEAPEKPTDQPAAEKPETAKPSIEAPQSWSDEMKAKWATLPPDAQSYIAQREGEAHKAITRAGEERKAFEPIRSVLESGKEVFQRAGMTPEQGLQAMLNVERGLSQNPTETIQRLAKAYGVDLSGTKPSQPQTQNPEVAALKAQLAEVTSYLTAQQRQAFDASQAELARTIADFSISESVKADWADVEEDMPGLIMSIRQRDPDKPPQKILEEAFQKAVWANDKVRSRRLEAERKAEEAKRQAEEAKRVNDARKSTGINVVGQPANSSTPKDNDAELREIWRRRHGT